MVANNYRRLLISKAVVILLCLCAVGSTKAQQFPDSKGTDFWFTFMPNMHNGSDTLELHPDQMLQHEIYIYIGADKPASGTITLKSKQGNVRVESFSITDSSQLFEFHTYFKPYEIVGFNRGMNIDYGTMQTEEAAEQSVHIVSDNDITVYALNQASLTSDAFLVLPTDALAEDYVVASYTSDIDWTVPDFPSPGPGSTPSQFCIVATLDNTVVDIKPTAPTFASPAREPQTVVLNAGQSYLVQVDPRITTNGDLTGSVVRASKPIAVFGGHQRAVLPIEDSWIVASRDCLIEQMNPIRTWGKSAFIFPFAISANEITSSLSRFRVIAAFDSTEVSLGGTPTALLNAGQFYEGKLEQPLEVTSTKPVMVSMLKKTAGGGGGPVATRIGDPFMMLVPPAEQFMDSYRFVNIQAYQYSLNPFTGKVTQGPPVYVEQYLAVVIPNAGLASLTLDGAPASTGFMPIPGTDYAWRNITMADGIHEIRSDTTFGIYVYGYGEANSYGYIGGMAFRPLDVQPPTISSIVECGVANGVVADSVIGDTRVKTASVIPGTEKNVVATINAFDPPQATVGFIARLLNPYGDGEFDVEATDNVRQTTQRHFDIPGFTIGALAEDSAPNLVRMNSIIAQHHQRCDTLKLVNYGKFPHTVSQIRTARNVPVVSKALPFTMMPLDTVDVLVCQEYNVAGIYEDTLIVQDTCLSRATYHLVTDVRADEEPPVTELSSLPCNSEYVATVADDREFDYGLRDCEILTALLQNCTVTLIDRTSLKARYRVVVVDALYDAVYGFASTDSAGNTAEFIDTIPGFTLGIDTTRGYLGSVELPSEQIGDVLCDTLWLSNYGAFTQIVNGVYVHGNQKFSTPQAQFPIIVVPGGRMPLELCYQPLQASTEPDLDSLEFTDGCLVKMIQVAAVAKETLYGGLSRCNVALASRQFSVAGAPLLAPNPATDVTTISLDTETPQLTIDIVSLQGSSVLTYTWQGVPALNFTVDISHVPAGTYALVTRAQGAIGRAILTVR